MTQQNGKQQLIHTSTMLCSPSCAHLWRLCVVFGWYKWNFRHRDFGLLCAEIDHELGSDLRVRLVDVRDCDVLIWRNGLWKVITTMSPTQPKTATNLCTEMGSQRWRSQLRTCQADRSVVDVLETSPLTVSSYLVPEGSNLRLKLYQRYYEGRSVRKFTREGSHVHIWGQIHQWFTAI